ncbi:50S ribosomal protein L3 [Candidatus Woesearchaeota archaeon]|nr:50S ribosomal protein L3 [Candidatus Woesearchaeota archaeon]
MPTTRQSRSGSMQVWPRKRARRHYPRVRAWAQRKDAALLGFAGYKVGMAHAMYTDNRKTSKTKGQDISCPITIVECPPVKIMGARLYKKDSYGNHAFKDIIVNADKELKRKISVPKKKAEKELEGLSTDDVSDIKAIICTQPKLTGIGKKKPEIFEVGIGGDLNSKLEYLKQNLGKEIKIEDAFSPGQLLDIHAVTKGKGLQGPVKRFGIGLTSQKSEKKRRGPGSLGGWKGQGHFMYRISSAGQMGCHTRTEYNKWVMKIASESKDIEEINPQKGFHRYGKIKNTFIIIRGSVAGPSKRMVRINAALRDSKKIPKEAPSIQKIIV